MELRLSKPSTNYKIEFERKREYDRFSIEKQGFAWRYGTVKVSSIGNDTKNFYINPLFRVEMKGVDIIVSGRMISKRNIYIIDIHDIN